MNRSPLPPFFALLIAMLFAGGSSCADLRGMRVSDDATPQLIYERAGCAACHGTERWGTEKAPGLRELTAHWTVKRLAEYIHAPAQNRDERLDALAARYREEMPGTGFLSLRQRTLLAEWLLGYE